MEVGQMGDVMWVRYIYYPECQHQGVTSDHSCFPRSLPLCCFPCFFPHNLPYNLPFFFVLLSDCLCYSQCEHCLFSIHILLSRLTGLGVVLTHLPDFGETSPTPCLDLSPLENNPKFDYVHVLLCFIWICLCYLPCFSVKTFALNFTSWTLSASGSL